jgi:hypothetical protein
LSALLAALPNDLAALATPFDVSPGGVGPFSVGVIGDPDIEALVGQQSGGGGADAGVGSGDDGDTWVCGGHGVPP